MRDDSAEILSQYFLQEAIASSSGMVRDVHSLMLFTQYFPCWPGHHPPPKVPWSMLFERLSWPNHASFHLCSWQDVKIQLRTQDLFKFLSSSNSVGVKRRGEGGWNAGAVFLTLCSNIRWWWEFCSVMEYYEGMLAARLCQCAVWTIVSFLCMLRQWRPTHPCPGENGDLDGYTA